VCVLAAFVIFASFYQPGTKFADRATRLHAGMTMEEAEQVMGCPPGDYQLRSGTRYIRVAHINYSGNISEFPTYERWAGEDGEVWVWRTSTRGPTPQISPITNVEWHGHRDRLRPRSLAVILWEEVSSFASPIAEAWDDTCKFFE
jgi:hypothetical protein